MADVPISVLPAGQVVAPYEPQSRVCIECKVRRHALFGALPEAELQQLHARIADVTLAPGDSLYSALAPGLAAYTVREGIVRLERISERGERRIVRLAGRGDLVGQEALLGQSYSVDAIACTPVRACCLPRGLVDVLADGQPALLRDLMRRWQRALDEADEWLTEMTAGSARWRILRLLLKLSEYSDDATRVWLPARVDIGSMLNMTVETASRLIAGLKREGVLKLPDARHAHIDMPRLLQALKVIADTD